LEKEKHRIAYRRDAMGLDTYVSMLLTRSTCVGVPSDGHRAGTRSTVNYAQAEGTKKCAVMHGGRYTCMHVGKQSRGSVVSPRLWAPKTPLLGCSRGHDSLAARAPNPPGPSPSHSFPTNWSTRHSLNARSLIHRLQDLSQENRKLTPLLPPFPHPASLTAHTHTRHTIQCTNSLTF